MKLFSDQVNFNDLKRNEWELKDPDKIKVKQNFTNNFDNTYTATFVLSGLPSNATDWAWKGKIEDNGGKKFQATDSITVNDAPQVGVTISEQSDRQAIRTLHEPRCSSVRDFVATRLRADCSRFVESRRCLAKAGCWY